ncbi:SPFH domain-containing protein [Massilia sp. W12]|uniref:SPFH domain-containing protein n=1 Tax=Massilia sp. W12 TaxID=3126507 RepID=UPI0030D2021F
MGNTLQSAFKKLKHQFQQSGASLRRCMSGCGRISAFLASRLLRNNKPVLCSALLGALLYLAYTHPEQESVRPGEVVLRVNRLSGAVDYFEAGRFIWLPLIHEARRYPARDQIYSRHHASHGAPWFQSQDGQALALDLSIRYKLDPGRLSAQTPHNIRHGLVAPKVDEVISTTLARYALHEIMSDKRAEVARQIEQQLHIKLAQEGVMLRSIALGQADLAPGLKQEMRAQLSHDLRHNMQRTALRPQPETIKPAPRHRV